MPGLLVTNNSGAVAREGEGRKRTHDGQLPPTMNGAVASVAGSPAHAPAQLADLPPELAHLGPEFYQPLTKLLQRASQETFNDLSDLLHGMANIPTPQQSNGVLANGYGGHANGAQDTSEANKQKKLMLIKFAQDNRAKFIKLLVLTEWGRKSAIDISKVIDLFQFVKGEEAAIDTIDERIEQIKVWSSVARQPNPDIRTALQILSKGKAEWIPDMGLIPPAPLSAEKVLNLFKYLNTSLAVRLNVHEKLPRHLKNWHVGSGRVTFVVDSEFELDVFAFSEDASKPWYFLDLRLLFTPAPSIAATSRFQLFLKAQLDATLANAGLSECYDFLHNFVLTHKIAVFRSQAHQLSRAGWAGSIKVEPVHRSLVVQYWTDRPGKKSWLEIGLSSGKPKNGKVSWKGPPVPCLAARWFRQGIEVREVNLDLDFHNLSLERTLKRIIALHIGHHLEAARNAISTNMTAKATFSEMEPGDCSLGVSLGGPDNSTTISLEPVTGRYTLKPYTPFSARAEHNINHARDPVAAIGPNLTQLLAQALQDSIQRHSQQLGWQIRSGKPLDKDSVKQATKLDVLQYTLYHPQGWNANWSLAAVISASGESWWCLETDSRTSTIHYSSQVRMKPSGARAPIHRTTLASIERVALQQLAFWVNKRALVAQNIPSAMKTEVNLSAPSGTENMPLGALRGWVLFLRTADLLVAHSDEDPWLEPSIRVTFHGFDADYVKVSHIATGTMVPSVAADMQKLMAASPPAGFTFHENGTFAMLLTTPFGEPMIDELKARLRDVNRLRSFTTILQQRKLKLIDSSLQQVKFQYGKNFKASVNFGQEHNIQVHLSAGNPHNRIRTFLVEIINERSPFFLPGQERTGLDRFCETLLFTRPILSTLTGLENAVPGNLHHPAVRAHHIGHYRITYANPLCSFDVKLKAKEDRTYWHIEDNIKRQPDTRPSLERNPNHKRLESLQSALNTLFSKQEQGWFGIRAGILADINGIPNALRALHQTVIACAAGGAYTLPPPICQHRIPPQMHIPLQSTQPYPRGATPRS
ncbi:MED14-domain-containing protein [Lophiostoma macrostomum CBS 122681]|uniref:Mediator of RNA polymerase II transcription subunit 14 n=1 Tax=Lophiostoma macrostomum CBS 122681 TaxID=1314788 RepID=A0A6A6TGR5_9PLEO|nr:MED14-domain-containing protein [Lophiostoma macrostomum CBS 122681]